LGLDETGLYQTRLETKKTNVWCMKCKYWRHPSWYWNVWHMTIVTQYIRLQQTAATAIYRVSVKEGATATVFDDNLLANVSDQFERFFRWSIHKIWTTDEAGIKPVSMHSCNSECKSEIVEKSVYIYRCYRKNKNYALFMHNARISFHKQCHVTSNCFICYPI